MAVLLTAPELEKQIKALRAAVQEAASDLGEAAVDLGVVLGAVVDAVKANSVATISNTAAVEANTAQQAKVASLLEQLIVILSPPPGPPKPGTATIRYRGEIAGFYTGDSIVPADKTLIGPITLPAAPAGKDVASVSGEVEWDRGGGVEIQPAIGGAPGSAYDDPDFGAPEGSVLTFRWRFTDNSGQVSEATEQVIDPVPDGEAPPAPGLATLAYRGEVANFYPD